jgi:hypothetical protein
MLCKLNCVICVISGFRLEVDEIYALLNNYKACSGNFLPTFRDKLSVPSSRAKKYYVGAICCPEMSVINYHCTLCNNPERRSSLLMNVMSVCQWAILRSVLWLGEVKEKKRKERFLTKLGRVRQTDLRPGWRSQANIGCAPSKHTVRFFMLIRPLFWDMMLCDGVIDFRLLGGAFILKGQYMLKDQGLVSSWSWRQHVSAKRQDPITPWRCVFSQKNGNLCYDAAKT